MSQKKRRKEYKSQRMGSRAMKLFPGHNMVDAHVAHSSWGCLCKTCRRSTFQCAGERLQRPHQATFLWVCAAEVAHATVGGPTLVHTWAALTGLEGLLIVTKSP